MVSQTVSLKEETLTPFCSRFCRNPGPGLATEGYLAFNFASSSFSARRPSSSYWMARKTTVNVSCSCLANTAHLFFDLNSPEVLVPSKTFPWFTKHNKIIIEVVNKRDLFTVNSVLGEGRWQQRRRRRPEEVRDCSLKTQDRHRVNLDALFGIIEGSLRELTPLLQNTWRFFWFLV